ncbi:hypothetical protein LXA43DRAFT_158426 [Ganoderma leucocontextum]|nr:hypothetical protein LXA43DRAFT_158426 [Ganoderma leucocontextum]
MSPFATMNDLPAELHDSALDLLIGDAKTLKACCATCKLWLPRAQRNLHLRVVVNQKNISSIHATLCAQPQLATVIRELTLNSINGTPKPPRDLHLPALRRLRLVDMDLSNSWVTTVVSTATSSLKEFSLRACHADEPTTFLTVIGGLSQLLHLDIEHCWSRSYGMSPIPDINAPELLSLSLVNYASLNVATATVFEACFEYPAAFSKLRMLDIRLPTGYADPFDRFLQVVGPSLRELTIGIRPETVLTRPLTLANCRGLRLLNFELKLKRPEEGVGHLCWLPSLLDSVQAPKLRRVKFVFKTQNATLKDFEAFDWYQVARTLDDTRFASVREVLFYVAHCDLPEDTVASLIHGRLGALDKRGLKVVQRA